MTPARLPMLAAAAVTALLVAAAPADAASSRSFPTYAVLSCRAGGTAVAGGDTDAGWLRDGVAMPDHPAIHVRARNRNAARWGTEGLIATILRGAEAVRLRHRRAHPIVVGDLSARRGGSLKRHASHQNGRDADIGYVLRAGRPTGFSPLRASRIDWDATWTLVDTMHRTGWVTHVFTDRAFIPYLRRAGARRASAARVEQVMGVVSHEPGHTSHLHVRVSDRASVCGPKERPAVARAGARRARPVPTRRRAIAGGHMARMLDNLRRVNHLAGI